jgi:peptidyl-prolyl cis-trans isomerase A (cyclophilin A)
MGLVAKTAFNKQQALKGPMLRRFVLSRIFASVPLALLAACGGGSGTDGVPTPPPSTHDQVVTQVTGMSAQPLPNNLFRVVLTPATGVDAAAFCVRTDSATPTATDACFQSASTQDIAAQGSATVSTVLRAWTRSSAGAVAFHQLLSMPGKTCSAAAYAASGATTGSTACLITDSGELVIALESDKAPITVNNFVRYLNSAFYNGTYFHRVKAGFVAQGGGFVWTGSAYSKKTSPYASIALESPASTGLSNTKNTVAMARSTALDSASTEFFINLVDNTSLDTVGGGYAVFGRVVYGQVTGQTPGSTLDSMAAVPVFASTVLGGELSQPTTPIALQWAYQIK